MRTYTKEDLLRYLQSQMDDYKKDVALFGENDWTNYKLEAMIACKEMVEALIQEPVNLQQDGKVTVGLF